VKQFVRESPATSFILTLWIAVFGAMVLYQGRLHVGNNIVAEGILPRVGNVFGSLTSTQLYAGQLWRPLTATWIHYSVIHVLGNMWVLYQVGPLIESWYGSGTFLFLYAAIGWLGNLLAGLVKPWLALALSGHVKIPDYPSGGGSGFDCGLIALLAVVGWRSRTRFGDYIRGQMVAFLVYVGIVGLVLPNVDNFGHAGGAIVGAGVGFLHRPLVRRGPRFSRAFGILGILILAACGYLQYNAARAETRALNSTEQQLRQSAQNWAIKLSQLVMIDRLYRELALRGASGGPIFDPIEGRIVGAPRERVVASLEAFLQALEAAPSGLDQGATATAYRDVLELARQAATRPPTPGELARFQKQMRLLGGSAKEQFDLSRSALAQIQQARRR
jgi:membrane associated rhomboid family serine protease